ncbi:MAG TPA: YihY/virulence factor BrkB family protein [Kineosporiaceae bacterium]|nr:YihY/virulence factor BrkB family protein [Kineosporiaceae bacterium]
MVDLEAAARRADRIQQGRPVLAFPFAVIKKFGDDQAGNLAALLAYYAFVSVFPLMLSFVTLLGIVLRGDPQLRDRLLSSAMVEFPVIGEQLRLQELHGSWWTVTISLAISLWGAQGVANAAQYAFNTLWNVPFSKRPGFLPATARSFGLLAVLGISILITGLLSGIGSSTGATGIPLRLLAFLASTLVNVGLFALAFRLATAREVTTRELILGAVLSAVLWQLLLAFGSLLVARQLRSAQSLYGVFGVLLGLLGWLHLQALITLYAVEADVVRSRELWPRSAVQPPLAPADRRAYAEYVQTQRRREPPEQRVEVNFHPPDPEPEPDPTPEPVPEPEPDPAPEPGPEAGPPVPPRHGDLS